MTPEQNAHVKTLVDKKEIFDYVVNHLRQQDRPGVDRDGDCSYRGRDDTMCAVGCLLADDEYDPSMEGEPVGEIELPLRLHEHIDMLDKLQAFHDCPYNWHSEGGLSDKGLYSLEGLCRTLGVN